MKRKILLVALGLLLLATAYCAVQRRCAEGRAIPVLMYHGVEDDPEGDVWTVSTADFRRQLEWLRDAGYTTLLPEDVARIRKGWGFLPRKPVILTFDDGYRNNHTTAEPVLREFGMKAICYLILGHVEDSDETRSSYRGRPNLTWEEVREMQKAGTFAFGIHSISHTPNLQAQAAEVQPARHVFRAKTGRKCRSYCYPNGVSGEAVYDAVRRKGRYTTSMSCGDTLFVYAKDADLYRIPRLSVYGGTRDVPLSLAQEDGAWCATASCQGKRLRATMALREPSGTLHFATEGVKKVGSNPKSFTWTQEALEGVDVTACELIFCDATGTIVYARRKPGE